MTGIYIDFREDIFQPRSWCNYVRVCMMYCTLLELEKTLKYPGRSEALSDGG